MNILITGGAGYIGSYITDMLISDSKVIIIDNLSTGHIDGIHPAATFFQGDIRDKDFLREVFTKNNIDVVIHMAALINVSESCEKPLEYYDVNTSGTLSLLRVMREFDVKKIVFSSTAAVYGEPEVKIIEEDTATLPINPYGKSKLYAEEYIIDYANSEDFNYIIFRYFNVAGGRKPGYDLSHMGSLIPKTLCSVKYDGCLHVNGNDYGTKDGTCVRDYIHIIDLAQAHVLAAKALSKKKNCAGIYNLGNGKGYTIMEVIASVENTLNCRVNYKVVDRRVGDPVYSVASSKRAFDILKWEPKIPNIDDIILHMWESNRS